MYWSWIKSQAGSFIDRGSNRTKDHKNNREDVTQGTKEGSRGIISKIACFLSLKSSKD